MRGASPDAPCVTAGGALVTEPPSVDQPTSGAEATPPVLSPLEPSDRAGNRAAGAEVTALAPGLTGTWEVQTSSSMHVWDLDRFTYTRVPGSAAARMTGDGVPHRIISVVAWPTVGNMSHVVFNDPGAPDLFRAVAPVRDDPVDPPQPETGDDRQVEPHGSEGSVAGRTRP